MKIVIAYDGSECAKAAVGDLRRSGMPRKADALVVSVGETLLPTPSLSSSAIIERSISHGSHRVGATLVQALAEAEQAMEVASALAQEGKQLVQANCSDWVIAAEPLVGMPADAIMQTADDRQADLIVVGSHGRSALERFVLGSVSKRVATESRCSVLVARQVVERGNAPGRIIIGVDGSDGARAAVHAVASRTWSAWTEARVIAVDDTLRPSGTMGLLPTAEAWVKHSHEEQIAKARAMFEQAAAELLAAGLQVSSRIEQGSPQDLLRDEAGTWEADCIFVGAQGLHRPLERFGLGNVSTALVTSAPCSVEVVRVRERAGG
jgi:nucleotide-binding universal stress UspA family protein